MNRGSRFWTSTIPAFMVGIGLFCLAIPAALADQVVNYQLYNVVLSGGQVVTGGFSYDFTTDSPTAVSIHVGGDTFDNSPSASTEVSTTLIDGTYDSIYTSDTLHLTFLSAITPTSGAAISKNLAQAYLNVNGSVNYGVVSGSVLPVSQLPKTTAALSGVPRANGWFGGPVTVTLKGTPGYLPIAATYFSLDGSTAVRYAGPFVVTGEAAHSLTIWSTDTGGLVETPHSLLIGIDATPPATTAYQYGETVTLAASDAASGVAHIYYAVNGGPTQTYTSAIIAPVGTDTIAYWSVDVAGNAESPHALTFTTKDTIPPKSPGSPHHVNATTVSWTASQDNVGVAGYRVYYEFARSGRGGGISWILLGTTTSTSFTIPSTYSSRTIGIRAFDTAGNQSALAIAI